MILFLLNIKLTKYIKQPKILNKDKKSGKTSDNKTCRNLEK